jgi:hypothetical protein
MDVDKNIFIRGLPEIAGVEYLFQFHEDNVRNFFHIVLSIIAFVLFFRTAKRKGYALAVIASWCMFAFFIPWQPWITRLQLPLFALSAPVFSFALEKGRFAKYRNLPLLAVACFSMMPLFLNETRPLKPLLKAALLKKPLSREKLLFANYGKHYSDAYRKACMKIIQEKPGAVGLVIGGDSWEYPLWACLRKNISDKPPSINHVKAGSIDQNINTLFVLDKDVSPFIGERRDTPVDSGPWVLRRAAKDTSKWEVVFDPRY